MPINLAIGANQTYMTVPKRSVLNVLTANSPAQAASKMSFWQWFADLFGKHLFGKPKHQMAIQALFNVIHAEDIENFQDRILVLANLAEKPTEFKQAFGLTLEQVGGQSQISVRFDDTSYIAQVKFDGGVVLDSDRFQATEESTDKCKEFRLRDEVPVFRRPLLEVKAKQSIYFDEVAKTVETYVTPDIGAQEITQMGRDFKGTLSNLPSTSENKEVLTKQRYVNLVLTGIDGISDSDRALHEKFYALSPAEQNSFELFCLGQLLADKLTGGAKIFHSEFTELSEDKQAQFKKMPFRSPRDPSCEQIKAMLSKLPTIQDQALLLVSTFQSYRGPLHALEQHFMKGDNVTERLTKHGKSATYTYQVVPSNNSSEVKIKVGATLKFVRMNDQRSDDPVVQAHQEISNMYYTVTFKENSEEDSKNSSKEKRQELMGATIKLDYTTCQSKLIVHNEDGTIPPVCKRSSHEIPTEIDSVFMEAGITQAWAEDNLFGVNMEKV